jgi:hypothetical protein
MKAGLAVLVVVLGATTAWLWLRTPTGHPQVESDITEGSLLGNDEPDAEEGDSGSGFGNDFVPSALPDTVPEAAPSPQVLEISPEAAELLFAVLADHRVQHEGQRRKETGTDPAQLELETQERNYARDTAISGVIGEAKMPRYKEYVGSLFERYEVIGLQVELMNSEDPLEFDDAQPVIEAMYDERQRIERELEAAHGAADADGEFTASFVVDGKKIADLDAKSNDRIFAAAARHLSPTQAKTFRRMLDNNVEIESLWNEILRMRTAAKAGQSN